MDMEVKDRLAAISAVELKHLDPDSLQFGHDHRHQPLGAAEQGRDGPVVELQEVTGPTVLWDDQRMARRLWVSVEKRQYVVVLIYPMTRQISSQNPRKDVIWVAYSVKAHDLCSFTGRAAAG